MSNRIWYDNTTRVSASDAVATQLDVYELGIRAVAAIELEAEFAEQISAIRLQKANAARVLAGAAA